MSKADMQLKQDIEAELLSDPKVHAAEVGATVDKGAITLRGGVDTYAEKWAAEDAARRVWGVRTPTQDLTVKLRPEHRQSDSGLEKAVNNAFKWNVFVPASVTATAKSGEVTLTGKVTWNDEREAAEHAIRSLNGVTLIRDKVTLTRAPRCASVRARSRTRPCSQRSQPTPAHRRPAHAAAGRERDLDGGSRCALSRLT